MAQNAPPELQNAINQSSQKYNVPVDILTGVWIKESGASFPNNYVNSSGYGGLFGTTNWNGSTQTQSDYSASILSRLHGTYGSWAAALYHYSGGGYTSVPGQTTSGGSFSPPNRTGGGKPTGGSNTTPATNPLDIGGAINDFGKTVQGIPAIVFSDAKIIGIGLGIGILGVLLIIAGIFVIIAPGVKSATEKTPIGAAVG